MMASRNPSSSSGAQQPDDERIFRVQLTYDKLKKVDLPVPGLWRRVVDKSSVLAANLDAKITNSRAFLFRSKLPRSLYKCVLGVKSGFLLVYSDSRSGYAFDLTSTTKITLHKEKTTKTVLKWRFCELTIYADNLCQTCAAGRLPLDVLISAFTVQRCSDNINVLCHRRPPVDSTATRALPEVPRDVYEPARCHDGVVMPTHALPSTSPAQQELCFSTVFPVSREQLDAVQLFLSNTIASSYDQDAVLSASLHISLSSLSAGDGAKVDNDDDTSSDASSDADNNSASAAE